MPRLAAGVLLKGCSALAFCTGFAAKPALGRSLFRPDAIALCRDTARQLRRAVACATVDGVSPRIRPQASFIAARESFMR